MKTFGVNVCKLEGATKEVRYFEVTLFIDIHTDIHILPVTRFNDVKLICLSTPKDLWLLALKSQNSLIDTSNLSTSCYAKH